MYASRKPSPFTQCVHFRFDGKDPITLDLYRPIRTNFDPEIFNFLPSSLQNATRQTSLEENHLKHNKNALVISASISSLKKKSFGVLQLKTFNCIYFLSLIPSLVYRNYYNKFLFIFIWQKTKQYTMLFILIDRQK